MHEVVSPLAPAARLLPSLAASAERITALLARPDAIAARELRAALTAAGLSAFV